MKIPKNMDAFSLIRELKLRKTAKFELKKITIGLQFSSSSPLEFTEIVSAVSSSYLLTNKNKQIFSLSELQSNNQRCSSNSKRKKVYSNLNIFEIL